MNELEQLRTRLKVFSGRYPEVAERFGLSYSWVFQFAQGVVTNPTYRNVSTLREALKTLEAEQSVPPQAPINNHHSEEGKSHVD